MKGFLTIFGMAAAGVAGYVAEPNLRFQLTGTKPGETADKGQISLQFGHGSEKVDLASLTPDQLPKTIKLNAEAKVSDAASGIAMTLPPGNEVDLVSLDGSYAVISKSNGQFVGRVAVLDTDLLQQLAANPPGAPATEPEPPAPEPVPEPAPEPPAGESEEPAPAPEPPPEPEPAPEPTPEPAPAPAPDPLALPEPSPINPGTADTEGGTQLDEASAIIVKAMQESVKAGAIKEFTFDQVTDWTPGAAETVDGNTYQTGIASYTAETIFGMKKIQAKALIKDGKVLRWIWPKSGLEIK